MADNTGYVYSADPQQFCYLWGAGIRYGSVSCVDRTDNFFVRGIEISDTTTLTDTTSFVQGSLIEPTEGLTMTLWDRTYVDGSMNPDGTMVDGTYLVRLYDPTWLTYSIWYLTPPSSVPEMAGYRERTVFNPSVGHYRAFLEAPDEPGHYEIRWRYQKDQSSHAKEIDVPFTVTSWGISSQPDYS